MASVAVVVKTISFLVTPNWRASVSKRKTTMKKSNASSVQPRKPASTAWCVPERAGCAEPDISVGLPLRRLGHQPRNRQRASDGENSKKQPFSIETKTKLADA